MYTVRTLLILMGLSISLLSCIDHRGVPPVNQQRSRLKYRYVDDQNPDTGKPQTSRAEFVYDQSGRLVGVNVSGSQDGGPLTPAYHTILRYEWSRNLQQETVVDELGNTLNTYSYEYDPLNRISRVLKDNRVDQTLTYDAQNRISGRTVYSYTGTLLVYVITESFSFDSGNNITTTIRTVRAQQGTGFASFRLKIVATFDQSPNPIYQLPTQLFQPPVTANSLYSPANATAETQFVTLQLTGDFPANAPFRTITHAPEYQNGLLSKDTVDQRGFRYEYEPY